MATDDYIWRIEDTNGGGPYNGTRMCYDTVDGTYNGKYHPAPWQDDLNMNLDRRKFGFADIPQARMWFHSAHDLRHWERTYDAKLVIYDRGSAGCLEFGKRQLVFHPGGPPPLKLPVSWLHDKMIGELVALADAHFATCTPTTNAQ